MPLSDSSPTDGQGCMFIQPHTPAVVLAPMDGVTDALMRTMLTQESPFTYCVSEFIRVSGIVPPKHVFLRDVPELLSGSITPTGTPVQVQILGGDPDRMAAAALEVVQLGAKGVDINFGCPAPTVNRHDGGATLLKFPDRIEAIVSAVRSAVPRNLPVSAKLRLGWDDPSAIVPNAERAERGGASWITIHGRTKMQGYTPPAYWKPIGEARRALSIPVVANGEVWTLDDLKRCIDESGCIHVMLGRGALARPELVAECAQALGCHSRSLPVGSEAAQAGSGSEDSWRTRLFALMELSERSGESPRKTLARVKQWVNYAHKRDEVNWFDSLKRITDLIELKRALVSATAQEAPALL